MTEGVVFVLDDGVTVQLDSSYRNHVVIEHGTFTTTTRLSGTGARGSYGSFFRSGLTFPLVAVKSTAIALGELYYNANNGQHGFLFTTGLDVGAQIEYFIFDVPSTAVDPHYGCQGFDAQGNKTFDIFEKYCRIIDVFDVQPRDSQARTYPAGRQYAHISVITSFSVSAQAGNTMITGASCNNGAFKCDGIVVDGTQGIPNTNAAIGKMIVVDVTAF